MDREPTIAQPTPERRHAPAKSKHYNLRRDALRHFIWYTIEGCIAIIGWTYGFGLEVKNWPALIGTLFLARWVFHVLQRAWMWQEAMDRAAEDTWPKLDKPAMVGAGRFGVGVSARLVVEAAQRRYADEATPEKEAARIARVQAGMDEIRKQIAESAAVALLREERDRLLATLMETRNALQIANEMVDGPIKDTIWMRDTPETLFDFMDVAIAMSTNPRRDNHEWDADADTDGGSRAGYECKICKQCDCPGREKSAQEGGAA